MSDPSQGRAQDLGPAREPHASDPRMYTADGVLITDGLVVMDNDMKIGTVDFARSDITAKYWDGWFRTSHGGLSNGERMATRHPFTGKLIVLPGQDS